MTGQAEGRGAEAPAMASPGDRRAGIDGWEDGGAACGRAARHVVSAGRSAGDGLPEEEGDDGGDDDPLETHDPIHLHA
jgi:hypothetical protein